LRIVCFSVVTLATFALPLWQQVSSRLPCLIPHAPLAGDVGGPFCAQDDNEENDAGLAMRQENSEG